MPGVNSLHDETFRPCGFVNRPGTDRRGDPDVGTEADADLPADEAHARAGLQLLRVANRRTGGRKIIVLSSSTSPSARPTSSPRIARNSPAGRGSAAKKYHARRHGACAGTPSEWQPPDDRSQQSTCGGRFQASFESQCARRCSSGAVAAGAGDRHPGAPTAAPAEARPRRAPRPRRSASSPRASARRPSNAGRDLRIGIDPRRSMRSSQDGESFRIAQQILQRRHQAQAGSPSDLETNLAK